MSPATICAVDPQRDLPTGHLILVATPIGNLEDLSPRAVRTLAEADVIACEDTRHTGRLLQHAGVATPMVALHEHNEDRRATDLVARAAAGEVVAVVSDAGTPGVSDPGFVLARAAAEAGVPVTAVPGPSAVLHALVVSGLPTDRFAFEGFLPRKASARRERLASVAADPRTLVFYVSPHRAADDLAAMVEAFGVDRPAALAREMTKRFEEVWRGPLADLQARAGEEPPRGEVTVVVGGAPQEDRTWDDEAVRARLAALAEQGRSTRDAVRQVTQESGRSKREVYDLATEG